MEQVILEKFLKYTNFSLEQIESIKPIHQGYTNDNFLIILKNQESYIVRQPNKKRKFKNEYYAYLNYLNTPFIYFDIKTGFYIKKKIIGQHPDLSDKTHLKAIIKEINFIHSIKLKKPIKKQNWKVYLKYNDLPKDIVNKFKNTVKKYNGEKLVFSHHDLNSLNILIHKNKVTLIDWEWARLDSEYFDFATLALEEKVDQDFLVKEAKLDKNKLTDYKFMILVFSHMWTNYMNTNKTLSLKKSILNSINSLNF